MKLPKKSRTPKYSKTTKLFLALIFLFLSVMVLTTALPEPYFTYGIYGILCLSFVILAFVILRIIWFILKNFPTLSYKSLYQYFFLAITVYTGGVYMAIVDYKMDITFSGKDTWLLYLYLGCVAVVFLISLIKTIYQHFKGKPKPRPWTVLSVISYLTYNSFLLYLGGKCLYWGLTQDTSLDDIYPAYSNPTLFAITGGLFLLLLVDFTFLVKLWNKLWSKNNSFTINLGYKEGSQYYFNSPNLKWLHTPIWQDYAPYTPFKLSDLYVNPEPINFYPPVEKLTPKQEKERRIMLYAMVSVAIYSILLIPVSFIVLFFIENFTFIHIITLIITIYLMKKFHAVESTHRGWGRQMLRKFKRLQYLEEPVKKSIKIPKIFSPLLVINEILVQMIKITFHLMGVFLLFFFGGQLLVELHKIPDYSNSELLDKIFMAGLEIFLGFLFFIYLYSSFIDFIRTIYWKEKK